MTMDDRPLTKKGRPKEKPGVKAMVVNLSRLPALCPIQATAAECASVLGISQDTLERRLKTEHGCTFTEFYNRHSAPGKCSLRRLQWKLARAGNPTMLIWLGKQWLGQTDKTEHAEDEATAQPVQVVVNVVDASVPRADA
jgi:hypothetical protein